jgi:uncharacterized membrane protein YtjA (UPF0391 family)
MLYWACVFLLVALFAAAVGFGMSGAALAVVAWVVCAVFLGLAVVSMVAVMARAQVRA